MILDFIKRLTHNVKRSALEKDIKETSKTLTEVSIPMAQSAVEVFRVLSKKSKEFERAGGEFYANANMRPGPYFLVDFLFLLENAAVNLMLVEDGVKKTLEENTLNDGLTLQKAHLIRAASAFSDLASLVPRFINFLMRAQEIENGSGDKFGKDELEVLRKQNNRLFTLLGNYGREPKKFEKDFKSIPDAMVTPANMTQVQAMFLKDIDPFSTSEASGFLFHPVLFIREGWADFLIARYKANQAQKSLFERRVLMLEAQKSGDNTAAIEKQISYYENEIAKLEDKIQSFEDKYGG